MNIGGFDFAAGTNRCGIGGGRFKPECVGIEREQAGLGSGSVPELEPEFDCWNLRRRPDQQQIGITDGMKSAGAAEGAADLITADGFSDVVNL